MIVSTKEKIDTFTLSKLTVFGSYRNYRERENTTHKKKSTFGNLISDDMYKELLQLSNRDSPPPAWRLYYTYIYIYVLR